MCHHLLISRLRVKILRRERGAHLVSALFPAARWLIEVSALTVRVVTLLVLRHALLSPNVCIGRINLRAEHSGLRHCLRVVVARYTVEALRSRHHGLLIVNLSSIWHGNVLAGVSLSSKKLTLEVLFLIVRAREELAIELGQRVRVQR